MKFDNGNSAAGGVADMTMITMKLVVVYEINEKKDNNANSVASRQSAMWGIVGLGRSTVTSLNSFD